MDSDYTPKEFSPFPSKTIAEAERSEIQKQVRENIDLLNDLVAHWDEMIDAITSKKTTPLEITLFPKRHAIHSRAEKRLLSAIENERTYVKGLIEDHA